LSECKNLQSFGLIWTEYINSSLLRKHKNLGILDLRFTEIKDIFPLKEFKTYIKF